MDTDQKRADRLLLNRLHDVIIRFKVVIKLCEAIYFQIAPPARWGWIVAVRHGDGSGRGRRETKGAETQYSSTNVFLTVLLDSGQCCVHTIDVGIHGISELQANSKLVIWNVQVGMKLYLTTYNGESARKT